MMITMPDCGWSSNLNKRRRACLGLACGAVLAAFAGCAGAPAVARLETVPVSFQGNQALSDAELEKAASEELARLQQPGNRGANADDAAFQMRIAYQNLGYAFVEITVVFTDQAGNPEVRFDIREGPKVLVQSIRLQGNRAYSAGDLLPFFEGVKAGFLGTGPRVFDRSTITAGAAALRDFYLGQGYLDVRVETPVFDFSADRSDVTVILVIQEGVRYIIRDLSVRGADVLPAVVAALPGVRDELVGKPYYSRQDFVFRTKLLDIYGNHGYPRTRVAVDAEANSMTGAVRLAADIRPGPRVTIVRIEVSGNSTVSSAFIRNRMELKPGDLYNQTKLRDSFRQLYATGLFREVSIDLEPGPEPDQGGVRVRVTEALSQEWYVQPGYGSYELLRLQGGFKERNLFGTGRILRADGTVSLKGESIQFGLTDPWLLNSRWQGDATVSYDRREEPAYTSQEIGLSLMTSRVLGGLVLVSAGYDYTLNQILDARADADLTGSATDYQTGTLTLSSSLDTRDNLLFPGRGQKSYLTASGTDPALGGQITALRLSAGTRWFLPVTKNSVLALRAATGFLLPGSGQLSIPLDQRFYNGGPDTVRSFQKDELGPVDPAGRPVGGLAYNVLNLEWRQRLFGGFVATFFFDAGNVAPGNSRDRVGIPAYPTRDLLVEATLRDYFSDVRTALGLGLGYLLPIGPARLEVGFNPAPDPERHEAVYAAHFSIGMAF